MQPSGCAISVVSNLANQISERATKGAPALILFQLFWPRAVDHAFDLWQGIERQSAREDLRGQILPVLPTEGTLRSHGLGGRRLSEAAGFGECGPTEGRDLHFASHGTLMKEVESSVVLILIVAWFALHAE
jgi:hypothetical protein